MPSLFEVGSPSSTVVFLFMVSILRFRLQLISLLFTIPFAVYRGVCKTSINYGHVKRSSNPWAISQVTLRLWVKWPSQKTFLTALYGEEHKPWLKSRSRQLRIWFGLILTHIHKIALTYIIPFICPKSSLFLESHPCYSPATPEKIRQYSVFDRPLGSSWTLSYWQPATFSRLRCDYDIINRCFNSTTQTQTEKWNE